MSGVEIYIIIIVLLLLLLYKPLKNSFKNTLSKKYVNKYF
jgi:hypothetical protein